MSKTRRRLLQTPQQATATLGHIFGDRAGGGEVLFEQRDETLERSVIRNVFAKGPADRSGKSWMECVRCGKFGHVRDQSVRRGGSPVDGRKNLILGTVKSAPTRLPEAPDEANPA